MACWWFLFRSLTCEVCWGMRLHWPQRSGPQTAILTSLSLFNSVHGGAEIILPVHGGAEILPSSFRINFWVSFWNFVDEVAKVKLGFWKWRLKGWDWESLWWRGTGRGEADGKICKSCREKEDKGRKRRQGQIKDRGEKGKNSVPRLWSKIIMY